MHRIIAAFAAIMFASSAFAADLNDKDYRGDDAGYLVMAISHPTSGVRVNRLVLSFRKIDRSDSGYIEYTTPKSFLGIPTPTSTVMDITTDVDTGTVVVRSLPPGDYELFHAAALNNEFPRRVLFSLPFTIKAKEATYLGAFQIFDKLRVGSISATAPSGFYFVVSDKRDRDIEIARRKSVLPLGPVTASVADAATLNIPLFRTDVDPVVTSFETASKYSIIGFAGPPPTNARAAARRLERSRPLCPVAICGSTTRLMHSILEACCTFRQNALTRPWRTSTRRSPSIGSPMRRIPTAARSIGRKASSTLPLQTKRKH